MELRDGWRILWRTADSVQIGADAPGALVLEGLDCAERDALLGRAPARGRVREALAALGLLEAPLDPSPPESLGDEAAVLTRSGLPGPATVAARARARVLVDGLPRAGADLALGLADAGVGTVLLRDAAPVRPTDLGPYDALGLGRPRAPVLAATLRARLPHGRVVALPDREPGRARAADAMAAGDQPPVDLYVLVRPWVVGLAEVGRLLAHDVPHLLLVTGELEAEVGPLVLPGVTACARCVALHRTDADPAWPTLATQLATWPARGLDRATELQAAASALQATLAHLDGRGGGLLTRRGPAQDHAGAEPGAGSETVSEMSSGADDRTRPAGPLTASLSFGSHDPLPAWRTWEPHPGCGCQGLESPGFEGQGLEGQGLEGQEKSSRPAGSPARALTTSGR